MSTSPTRQATPATHDDVVATSERVAEVFARTSADSEALRHLAPEAIETVRASGLLSMVAPRSLGGAGLGVRTLAESTRVMAHGCVSSAWATSFLVLHTWMLAKMPAAARADLFAGGAMPLAPAPLAPTGTVTPTTDGFVLRGRWEWATSVHHSDWVLVHAAQTEPEFTTVFAVVPTDQVEIEDVWHTSGMCATGSDAVRIDDVFVPAHRVVGAAAMLFGGDVIDGDGMALLPVPQTLALVAASPALGAAERAVELFRQRVASRVLAYSLGDTAIDQASARMRLGAARAELAATRALWDASIVELDGHAGVGDVPLERRMALRLAASTIVRSSRRIVNDLAEAAGASVYFTSSPFQRIQRDLEVLKGHVVFDWDRTTELAGRVALGLPLAPTDMV